jgi:hypothetical protein
MTVQMVTLFLPRFEIVGERNERKTAFPISTEQLDSVALRRFLGDDNSLLSRKYRVAISVFPVIRSETFCSTSRR